MNSDSAFKGVQMEERYDKPNLPNRTNGKTTIEEEMAEREILTDETLRIIKKLLPDLLTDLAKIMDDRKKNVRYTLPMLMVYGILQFALHYTSRRETNREMTAPIIRENLKALFPELGTLPHGDTLYRLLDTIEVVKIEEAQCKLIKVLMYNKKFKNYLVNGKYRIAIDGTQKLARKGEWGDEYLLRHVGKNKEPQSYIYVLEAVLVLENGMTIPFMSEFLTNRDSESENDSLEKIKQDCERKAFRRLAKRIRKMFPKQPLVLMMDSLYATGPVLAICKDNNWDYMINFKEGSMPAVFKEAQTLMKFTPENKVHAMWGNRKQIYTYINNLEYDYIDQETGGVRRLKLNVAQCFEQWVEIKADGSREENETTYVWLSARALKESNVFSRCTLIARYRWQIENNILVEKHQGYGYSHIYASSVNALKGYHYLSKIAHFIMTLVMMSSKVIEKVREVGKRGFIRFLRRCLEGSLLRLERIRSDRLGYLQLVA